MSARKPIGDTALQELQREAFSYFLYETNPVNGLVTDKTAADWPAIIAATGLALASYPVGVERGFISRPTASMRTLATLRFFWNSPQDPEPDATGYKGSFPRHADRTARLAMRAVDDRQRVSAGGRADGELVF